MENQHMEQGVRRSPEPPEPPQPPQPPQPEPSPRALTPTAGTTDLVLPGGMPGQREGRPTTISEAALQLTLKWMDHTSDAAELALGDPELSEAQAQSVITFFVNVYESLQPHFPVSAETDRR